MWRYITYTACVKKIHKLQLGKEVTLINFRIRELRLGKGLTQAQLSRNLGLKSQSTVAMWENGHRKPPSTILPRLAEELGCTIDELFAREPPGRDSA